MKILIISDIHREISMFDKLKLYFKKVDNKIDAIFILGLPFLNLKFVYYFFQ